MNQTLHNVLLSCLFLCFPFSKSYTATIQTASSGDWNTPSIWKGGVVPTIEDEVIILATHTITVPTLNIDADSYCNSLIINGVLIIKNATLVVGNWGTRASFCLINGTLQLEGDYNHQLKVHGFMNLNGGSKFLMSSGVLNLDGCSGKESTSVAANQAIFDIGGASIFKATAGAIIITNPHFHPTGVCVRGVQKFDNTLVWGNNLHTPVLSPNDFIISETEKPILTNMRLSYISYPNKATRFSTKDLELSGILNVNAGIYYGTGTLKIPKDLLLGDSVLLESNVEFNGTAQQNILTYGTNTSCVIKGNVIVNNPDRVKIKIDLDIQNGKLIFNQGKLDLSVKTLTLQSQPVGANASRYVVSFDLYQNIGNLLIKNVTASDTTLFPLGSEVAYLPVTLTATSGDFSVSAYPFTLDSTRIAQGFSSLNNEWQIKRVKGNAIANVEFQWNTSNESAEFSAKRANCNLYRFENKNWKVLGDKAGPSTIKSTVFTKSVRFVDNFTSFTLFSTANAVVTGTQDLGSADASIAYPNPLSESSILTVKLMNPSTVKVYDVHARLISAAQSKEEILNFETHQWAKGIYFIHITNLLGSKVLKVFKN